MKYRESCKSSGNSSNGYHVRTFYQSNNEVYVGQILTKGQREAVSDFLVALTREMQPAALLPLLRKLTIDVSKLSEYTTVALRVGHVTPGHLHHLMVTRHLTCAHGQQMI